MIHVYKKGTGEIVEVCTDGSDVSRFSRKYVIVRNAPSIERERYKYINGELREVVPPKSNFEKAVDELERWRTNWEMLNTEIMPIYKEISTRLNATRSDIDPPAFSGGFHQLGNLSGERSLPPVLGFSEFAHSMNSLENAVMDMESGKSMRWVNFGLSLHLSFYQFLIFAINIKRGREGICSPSKDGKRHKIKNFSTIFDMAQEEGNLVSFKNPSKPYSLVLSEEEKQRILDYHENYRNEFMHFPPQHIFFSPQIQIITFLVFLKAYTLLVSDIIPNRSTHSKLKFVSALQRAADLLMEEHINYGTNYC